MERQQGMRDQLSPFGEEAMVRPLEGGEAGSRSAPTGERQASSVSEGNRALVTDTLMERVCEAKNRTPQGGPLSPLLANLLLDELDKELERRGHRFCRYADDVNIYVKSKPHRDVS